MVDDSGPSMAGKIVLVTGGTDGIGKATASGLAVLGADLAVTGRDRARTEAAAESIRAASGNGGVRAFAADLSVQSEVRRLAADVLDTYPRLDVLVNNVGGRGGEDLDLPRLVPGRGGRQRYVLRQGQGQVREQVRVRLRDGCPPVAGQRRPGGAAVPDADGPRCPTRSAQHVGASTAPQIRAGRATLHAAGVDGRARRGMTERQMAPITATPPPDPRQTRATSMARRSAAAGSSQTRASTAVNGSGTRPGSSASTSSTA